MKQLQLVTFLEGKKLNAANERIKELKKEKNITDGMIGEVIQYHPKVVNRMLNKKAKIPEDVIVTLSEYLEVSPEYLKGHSEFRTREEQEYHILAQKYKLVIDIVNSIKHLNLGFAPYFIWTRNDSSEMDKINYILEAADDPSKCKEISSTTNLNDLVCMKECQLYTCRENEPIALFFDYERNHMGKGNIYCFHEVMHNGERTGIISHEKFLHLIDNINNNIANLISLTLGLISTEV
ncbi:Helix-turn-helix [Pseudobutyrivibrio sp. C4]|uniref:helix-turn-helix domain-containing protein n=1 Tax=Pseudobutyrivibrio sp. C4 TaxID=1520803 RepID=UPI0008BC08D2|nr:helix-turn-helix transcriptional regulator [Pseudobutyrivibrio sp. C4]SES91744.1 Helix-turn-helix [Pseudobutyrivibrio sp. C4]